MKPINAENPITPDDVGRLAVRRDGGRVKVMRWGATDTDYPVLESTENWVTRSGRYWTHRETSCDLIGWAEEAPASSPLTVDLIVRVPLAQVSEFVSENEVVGKHGGVK